MLHLNISPSSGVPIYKQVLEQVEIMIVSGQLSAGELLPSVRQIASEIDVNPMTISKAYGLLEERGHLNRLRGKGMAVAQREQHVCKQEKLDMLSNKIQQIVNEAKQMGVSHQELIELFQSSVAQQAQSLSNAASSIQSPKKENKS
jgi:GntR family transcriptional regulator